MRPIGPTTCDALLAALRAGRGFVGPDVLASKIGRLNRWFAAEGLDAAVVGVSGGVDSAVVLGLLDAAQRTPGSPIRRVVALVVPIDGPGATGQEIAGRRAVAVADHFDVERWVCPLAAAHHAFLDALTVGSGLAPDAWVAGQMLSVERTPLAYGAAALLQAAGRRSVVVGTINRDEGAYLGFFGKASDGAVDLQPISDLHKAEVRALAGLLGVPSDVVDAAPTGDVWDGRTDEEMIGVDYDRVELVLRLLELRRDPTTIAATLIDGERLLEAAEAVRRLHSVNAHKYAVGSPAVHLDVLPRAVPGGWGDEVLSGRDERPPPDLPGRWSPPPIALSPIGVLPVVETRGVAVVARGVLTVEDCATLLAALADAPAEEVGVTGVRDSYGVGSRRSTAFDPPLAAALWERLAPAVVGSRHFGATADTDAHATDERDGHRTWRAVGLSPVLRFMTYRPGGRHLCHYDAGFDYGDGRRTLSSVVVFLTHAGLGDGGELRFVDDGQAERPTWERDHRDWNRDTDGTEVIDAIAPEAGAAVVFDHRRCHDVGAWRGPGTRVVIRADVVYERIPDGSSLP